MNPDRYSLSPHVLERSGLVWPPKFFTGQAGCFCCSPPADAAYYYGSSYNPRSLWSCCKLGGTLYDIPTTLYVTLTSATASCFNNRTVALLGCNSCEWSISHQSSILTPFMTAPCDTLGCGTLMWTNALSTGCHSSQRVAINFRRSSVGADAKYVLSIEQRFIIAGGCFASAEIVPTSCVPFLWAATFDIGATDLYCNSPPSGCGGGGTHTVTFTVTE